VLCGEESKVISCAEFKDFPGCFLHPYFVFVRSLLAFAC
jgi:hypothetical protein